MIPVRLTWQMVRRARQYAARVMKTATLQESVNYTGLCAPGRYFTGHLGELALVKLVAWNGKYYDYRPAADGRPDAGDITVFIAGRPLRVDVKTASKPGHRYLMIPEAQFRKRHRDAYLGARLDLEAMICEIHGIATRAQMEDAPVEDPPQFSLKVRTRMTLLSDLLLPVEAWLRQLDNATWEQARNAP